MLACYHCSEHESSVYMTLYVIVLNIKVFPQY